MDLIQLLVVVRRRFLLVLSFVVVACLALGLGFSARPPVYEGQVRVQITAPQPDDVTLFSGYRASSLLEDLTLARNNFLTVLTSVGVRDRTIAQLGLQYPDTLYEVEVRPLRDTDFIDIIVPAREPVLAEHIANTHVAEAIHRYGELRAKPASATKMYLAERLRDAAEKVRATEGAASTTAPDEAQQARDTYQLLLKKYAEADLVEKNTLQVSYIQVVEPAEAPAAPTGKRRMAAELVLGITGSLGAGILFALLLESLSVRRSAIASTPGADASKRVQQVRLENPVAGWR